MSLRLLTAWVPAGPPTRNDLVLGAVGVTIGLVALGGAVHSWHWFGGGVLVAVLTVAMFADDANLNEPAYEDGDRSPLEAIGYPVGLVFGVNLLGPEIGVALVTDAQQVSSGLGAIVVFAPIAVVKLARTRRISDRD